ncbi:MAG: sensor histidine kinase [Treponema sp.]|nr:sensor histidine kinase [Treponema sp.]
MNVSEEQVRHLYSIIHSYTIFFIVFDVVFFVGAVGAIILAIKFLKSKRNSENSAEHLKFTIQGQEEERARIARELHDTVAQDLRYCKSLAEKLEQSELSSILEKSLYEVRSMSYNLAPPDVTRNDLVANLVNLCQTFEERSSIDFRLTVTEGIDTYFLTQTENLNLYRIVQESLNNIIKHADATEVTVLVRNQIGTEPKGIYIFITDDGKGFDVRRRRKVAAETKHFGLFGMSERARFIGAELDISSEEGAGTQVTIVKRMETI